MDRLIDVGKTKALIICAVTAQLICAFVSHMQRASFLMMRLIYNGNTLITPRTKALEFYAIYINDRSGLDL